MNKKVAGASSSSATKPREQDAPATLVPRLRFPEFRDAGEWKNSRLGDTSDVRTGPFGSVLHQSDYVETGTPIVTVEHLSEWGLIHKNLPLVSTTDVQRLKNYILHSGDIVFSRVGSVDRNSLIRDDEHGWLFSGRLLRIRTNRKVLNPFFLSAFFQLELIKSRLRSVAVGQTMASLNTEIMNDFVVMFPTLSEQQRIADCLSSLDALIAAQARKVDALKSHKKGLMQQLFPRDGETQPRLRFPEFQDAGEWEVRSLEEVLSPAVRERPKPTEAYTGLGLRSHGKGTFLKPLEDPSKNSMDELYEVKTNDLIVNITFAWEGALAIAKDFDEGALVSHRFPTYTFEKGRSIPEFFRYIILDKQFIYNLGVISPGGAGRNRVLSKKDFLKLQVVIPNLPEQQRIADCLSSLDELISAATQRLATLKTHKQGLMQQLFPNVAGASSSADIHTREQDAPATLKD